MNAYDPEKYQPDLLGTWISIAERQAAKDAVLIPMVAGQFRSGRVLELGSGTGHIAVILRTLGWDVVASDYAPFFVEHLKARGLVAHRVDATDIEAANLGTFRNIFCQSITPFITTDYAVVQRAYRSAFSSLEVGGRLVLIHAMAKRSELADEMETHRAFCRAAGFRQVRVQRNQLLPSAAYRVAPGLSAMLEARWAPMLGSRFVLTASRPL